MRRASVFALAAAREQYGQERQGEENESSVHATPYVRGSLAVCATAANVAVAVGALAALAAAPSVVARIVTGTAPCGVASGFGSVWVAVYGGTLVRIDPGRNRIVRRIRVAAGICPIAAGAGSIWVASDKKDLLYRVDPRRGRIVARVRVGHWPAHVAVAGRAVWVSSYDRGTLTRIDARSNRVERVYDVGGHPSGVAVADGTVWLAFGRDGTALGRLDPASGALTRVPIGHSSPGFLQAIGDSIWTTTSDGHAVRVDRATNRVVGTFPIPGTPAEVAGAPDGTIWVAEKERSTLTRIDPVKNRVLEVTDAGPGAFSIAVAAGDMWVTSFAGSDVWRWRAR